MSTQLNLFFFATNINVTNPVKKYPTTFAAVTKKHQHIPVCHDFAVDSHPPNSVSIYQSVTSLLWTHIHQTMSAYTSLSQLCCGLTVDLHPPNNICIYQFVTTLLLTYIHQTMSAYLWTHIHQTTSAYTSLSRLCCGLTSTQQHQHIPVCHDFAVDHETTPACTLVQRRTHRRLVVLQPDTGHGGEGSEAPRLEEVDAEGVLHQARAPPDLVVQSTEI